MLLANVLVLATGALAWKFPHDQPNGVYSVSVDSAGNADHSFIKAVTPIATKSKRTLGTSAKFHHKRQCSNCSMNCNGYTLDTDNTGDATGNLEDQCGAGTVVGPHLDFYAIFGGTVAYFCNESGPSSSVVCSSKDLWASFNAIMGTCGGYGAGWESEDGGRTQTGYEATNSDFCHRGTSP